MKEKQYTIVARNVILIALLAIVCIGGMELLVCRIVDPALYERIMSPVRIKAMIVLENALDAGEDLTSLLFPADEGSIHENQYITDPAIWIDLSSRSDETIVLEEKNGHEVLSGGANNVIYYNQTDAAWAEKLYGSDQIGRYGCGPVVMAMAVSSLTDQNINPEEMALWAKKHGYWAKKSGSYLSIVEGAAGEFGLSAESCQSADISRLQQELASGKLAVALMRKGHFTNGGHFVLLCGTSLDGRILVADPSSRERSLASWDAALILNELSYSRQDGAPLWFLQPS